MCHSYNGRCSEREISSASCVLPVPGSPLISSGRDSVTAAFTAIMRSGVATYLSVPEKRACVMGPAYRVVLGTEYQPVRRRARQERSGTPGGPVVETAAIEGRKRVAGGAARQFEIAFGLATR